MTIYQTMTDLDLIYQNQRALILLKIPADLPQDDGVARDLAQKNKPAVIPGSAFGPGIHARLSYSINGNIGRSNGTLNSILRRIAILKF